MICDYIPFCDADARWKERCRCDGGVGVSDGDVVDGLCTWTCACV